MSECLVCFSPLQFLGAENITEEACSSNSRIEREEKTEGGTRWYRRWTSHGERRPEITAGRGRSSSFRPRPNDGRRPLNGRSRHEYVTTEISLLFYYFLFFVPLKRHLWCALPPNSQSVEWRRHFADETNSVRALLVECNLQNGQHFVSHRDGPRQSILLLCALSPISAPCQLIALARGQRYCWTYIQLSFFFFFNLLWLRFSLSCRVVVRNKDGN